MSANTSIEWTDSTLNWWEGCTKVGPGCDHCYAETRNARFGGGQTINWGPGAPRRLTSEHNRNNLRRWNKREFVQCASCGWRGEKRDFKRTDDGGFAHSMCPNCSGVDYIAARRRVFCSSLSDVFDNEVPQEWRDAMFAEMETNTELDFLVLTKRIGNVRRMVPARWLEPGGWPAHVWLGATICNQPEADRDIPKLLAVPAGVRFLSMEPLLGPVNLWLPTRRWENSAGYASCDHCCNGDRCDDPTHYERGRPEWNVRCPYCRGTGNGNPIDWVIVGGESGPGARPMHPDWARSLRDQCAAAGVPFLFKQWGEWASVSEAAGEGPHHRFDDGATVRRIGKKAAGRTLDGTTHDGFPEITCSIR